MGCKVPENVCEDGDQRGGQSESRGYETVSVDSYKYGDEDSQGGEVLSQMSCRRD